MGSFFPKIFMSSSSFLLCVRTSVSYRWFVIKVWCFPLVFESLGITLARCIPLNSRSKTRQRVTLLLLTWIYLCRSGGTVNFTLAFITNMTSSISSSPIFRSWVAIFQHRPPMASLFRRLYGMPRLAPRMDVLSWGRRDFQISFLNRDTPRNASNRHWGSYGRYGDLIKKYKVSFSQILNDIMWPDHIQWQPPTDQTLYRTRPLTEFWVVSIEHLRRVWHADRGRLLLRTLGPVPLGLAYVLLVETNPIPNLSLFFRTMLFEYPSVLSRFCLEHYLTITIIRLL